MITLHFFFSIFLNEGRLRIFRHNYYYHCHDTLQYITYYYYGLIIKYTRREIYIITLYVRSPHIMCVLTCRQSAVQYWRYITYQAGFFDRLNVTIFQILSQVRNILVFYIFFSFFIFIFCFVCKQLINPKSCSLRQCISVVN